METKFRFPGIECKKWMDLPLLGSYTRFSSPPILLDERIDQYITGEIAIDDPVVVSHTFYIQYNRLLWLLPSKKIYVFHFHKIVFSFSDCVANVDSRAESIEKKIGRLDAELRKYKVSCFFHFVREGR